MTFAGGVSPTPNGQVEDQLLASFVMRPDPVGRTRIFGIDVDIVTVEQAIARILHWCVAGERHIVVTPNVDHALAYRRNPALRAAYARAGLVLADGMPLIWASRLGGPPLKERVTGSDLIEPLCRAATGRSVFLLGSSFPTLAAAAARLTRTGVGIAGVYAPPYGEAFDEAENAAVVDMINSVRPDIVLVALGMPKQELWAVRNLDKLQTHAVLCIGAGLDYLAGAVSRAPEPFRRLGLEWLWRAASEPARLGPRYARNLLQLPLLFAGQLREAARGRR